MLISTATVNPVLTGILQRYIMDAATLVGTKIAPIFLTGAQSAQYYVFDKDNALSIPRDLQRAPGMPYKRTFMKLSSDSYNCSNKGIEIPVDDEERAKYAAAFSADQAAMKRTRDIVMINHELRVHDLVVGGTTPTSAIIHQWDDYADTASNPLTDVNAVKEVIHDATGMDANLMVIPRKVYLALLEHPLLMSRIVYSQKGIITLDLLKEFFGLDIAVAGGMFDTAADGQVVVPDSIWGDDIWIGHSEQTADLQAPNFARTFIWTAQTGPDGVLVESYRQDEIQSDIHRAKQHSDEKITGAELGYHLSDALL